jgi:ABC-type xylose transport system permease subunit
MTKLRPGHLARYTVGRSGYALAGGGGWALAALIGALVLADFATRAFPILHK